MSSVRDANSWACFTKPESIFLGLLLAIAGTALAQGDWRSLLALVIALVAWSIVEVHCGLAAGGTACQPGQEEPGASRVLVELDANSPCSQDSSFLALSAQVFCRVSRSSRFAER